MKDYLFILIIAAVVTYLLTPLVRRGAIAVNAQHAPRARDVHTHPTPLLGGLAIVCSPWLSALTTLGFGPDELDEIADIFAAALGATTPAGGTSKAKYVIDPKVAADSRDRCAELLGRHPLYPGIEL